MKGESGVDISLYYQEQGEGEPLFLLHGNGEDGTYFANQISFFSDRYRVIAVDTRGHGKSPRGTGPFIMELFAGKSEEAKSHMEILGLMVNEPNIRPEELCAIQAPTLVIAGTKDMIKTAHTELIADHIPNAKLSVIPGDHFIANKNPKDFNREVENFLLHR